MTYHGVAYLGDHDISAGISVEQIKACDLRPDFDSTRYEITQEIYGNTGGGCMVGTLAVRYPELEKTPCGSTVMTRGLSLLGRLCLE